MSVRDWSGDFATSPATAGGVARLARPIIEILRQHRRLVALVILFSLLTSFAEILGVGVIFPFFEVLVGRDTHPGSISTPIAPLVQYLLPFSIPEKVRLFALLMLGIMIFRQAVLYANARIVNRVKMRIDSSLRRTIFAHFLFMDMGRFYRETISELFSVLNNFTGYSSNFIFCLLSLIPQVVLLATYISLLLLISPAITALTIGGILATQLALRPLVERRRFWAQRNKDIAVAINSIGFEALSAMKLIRLCVREEFERDKLEKALTELRLISARAVHFETMSGGLFLISGWLVMSLAIIVSTVVFTEDGTMWTEKILLYVFILSRLMGPAGSLNSLRLQMAANLPFTYRLVDFLSKHPDQRLEGASVNHSQAVPGTIEFRDVSFRYADEEPFALQHLYLTIFANKTVAVVGPSGAGKSTLVDLLVLLHHPTTGSILNDGEDICRTDLHAWRRQIAVVSQDSYLFNCSAMDNIRYGRLDASDDEIIEAARQANADEFLSRMPNGYHTLLGERGVRLSGGQAQRIAIARAFLSNPTLLILDEATSAQDSESELQVRMAVDRLSMNRTVLVIAHRLATVQSADIIYFLENGKVVESGRHLDLIEAKGRYANFVRLQDISRRAAADVQDVTF